MEDERVQLDMFKDYVDSNVEKIIPDNRGGNLVGDAGPRDIIYKGTNSLVFCIEGLERDDVADLTVGIKSGLNLVYTKGIDDVSITRVGPDLYIEYIMDEEESSAIDPRWDFHTQCKVILINGDIIYTPIIKYRVKNVLF